MPRKSDTKVPQKKIDQFIRRHLEGGEGVAELAKEFGIARASGYLWLAKHRQKVVDESFRADMTAEAMAKQDKATLVAELVQLKQENMKLRNKVVSLMIKAGEL
jgi:transposase-like protein